MSHKAPNIPISLYIHWPYCRRICPYCDFNVTRDRGQADQQHALFEAICADLKAQRRLIGERHLVSIFFGGGTPSLMKPEWVAELILLAKQLFVPLGAVEVTMEANPTDAEMAKYQAFAQAGINRLSLGVQSFDDKALKFLGRDHSAKEALKAIELAQYSFARLSIDLIYALPDQDLTSWRCELDQAARSGFEHISPYQLTIEDATAFGRAVRRGKWQPLDEDKGSAFFELTQDVLNTHGYEAYEVSNHARGLSAQSVHNVHIWRGGDYIGIGPGAHGRLMLKPAQGRLTLKPAHGQLSFGAERQATTAHSDLKTYMGAIASGKTGYEIEALSLIEAQEERVLLGLRLAEGINMADFAGLPLMATSKPLIEQGFLSLTNGRLSATPQGRLVLNRLIFELLA